MKVNYKYTVGYIRTVLMLLPVMFFFVPGLQAQVTVGDTKAPESYSLLEIVSGQTKGGLRLPQLTTAERDVLTTTTFKTDSKAEGLAIFNTTTKCYEYWNGTRWVSLCKGDANITFTDPGGAVVDPFAIDFPCAGETRGSFFPHDTPDCTGIAVPYGFLVMIGDAYTLLDVLNASTGEFKLTMNPNPTARTRIAVLRVTNNCTGEYKEFLFTQEGCTNVCQPGIAKPNINIQPSDVACGLGAVYMNITNPDASANYIWTLNDVELTGYTGKTYCAATQSGTYKVYVGGIGCDMNASDPISVTINNTNIAPAAVGSITASNNGVICGSANVKLTAYNVPVTGTLTWYKDGVKTSETGNPISLIAGDEGDWFAVMENGGCTSKPSNIVIVSYDNSSTAIADPVITVNGEVLTSATFCKGGVTVLDVFNITSYTTGVTVTWYDGTTLLGTGTPFEFTPSSDNIILRCVVHDNTGIYCDAEVIVSKVVQGIAPARPSISGNPFICGGSYTLLSTAPTGESYKWFRNGTEIQGANTYTYQAELAGQYQVQVVNGSCISPKSAVVDVKISAFPTVAFVLPQTQAQATSVVTYEVAASQNPTSYVWTLQGTGASLLDGSAPGTQNSTTTTNTMRIKMGTSETTLTCMAVNACGNSNVASQMITIKTGCTPVAIGNISMTPTGDVLAGTWVTMSVTPTGTTPYTYQWKRNGTDISVATDATYGFTAATADNGTYTVTVGGCDDSSVTGTAGTINVLDISTIPDGTGKLTGKDCFDINQSNWNTTCGLQPQRQTADFTTTYTYTFTNMGTGNSDLTWLIGENPAGAIIDYNASTINNVSGALINGSIYTITIKYKQSLMTDALGTTDANAFKANIYAIYKTGETPYKQLLTVTIKDCRCGCGAMTTSGTWLAFMCHNLGADESLDPFIPSTGLYGDTYQWGRPKDGHEKRNSATTTTLATNNEATAPSGVVGKFIISQQTANHDWRGGNSNARWGDGLTTNPPKTANDPCPDGWKVPSQAQWQSIYKPSGSGISAQATANTWTWTTSGYKVGDALYLPAAGFRDYYYGKVEFVDTAGNYWSSTANDAKSYGLNISVNRVDPTNITYRAGGFSVRCVAE